MSDLRKQFLIPLSVFPFIINLFRLSTAHYFRWNKFRFCGEFPLLYVELLEGDVSCRTPLWHQC